MLSAYLIILKQFTVMLLYMRISLVFVTEQKPEELFGFLSLQTKWNNFDAYYNTGELYNIRLTLRLFEAINTILQMLFCSAFEI